MGSCLSSAGQPPATAAAEDGKAVSDRAFSVGSSSARSRLASRSWRERTKLKKKEKEKKGGGERSAEAPGGAGGDLQGDELHRLPGRMFVNGASEVACLYTQQGKKGTNQDAMIVWENFTLRSDTVFCGVFDGHGPFGHMVAKKVRDSLPLKLSSQWIAKLFEHESPHLNGSRPGSMDSEETASIIMDDELGDANEKEKVPEMFLPLKQSFFKAFKSMDKELKFHPTIDCFCSGTTAVTLVKQGQELVIGNLGDSRAVMGTRDKDNELLAVQLTVDLKPNLPREAARIQQCRGRVFALQDEPDVARVWLPNNDSPGLAMARAFGDFCLKDYGLISVPDISYRHLTKKDEFIVLATDGVWDVLSNKEVVDIVASAPNRASAARALVDYAVRAWRLKFPTSKIDDCAAVCLFLEIPSSTKELSQDIPQEPTDDAAKIRSFADTEAGNQETNDAVISAAQNSIEVHDSVSSAAQNYISENFYTLQEEVEIVPVSETVKVERVSERPQSTRSLADCITAADDEEWTALEGLTRVNTLLNVPRFLSNDRRSTSWRKWF